MFGRGFTEIILIDVLAIIFIGPEKLPSTMVDIAKFFRNVKNTIGTVKDSIEEEMNVSDIKKEALAYKEELLNATEGLNPVSDITTGLSNLNKDITSMDDKKLKAPKAVKKPEKVTFSKKKKKENSADKVKESNPEQTKTKKEDEINV
jgi:sec-independent protein translocase protein TatB